MSATNNQIKTISINNRRYLGNKYKLLPFISEVVNSECSDINVFADIFSGTGSVSSAFINKIIITNDIMYSNYICNYAWFSSEKFNYQTILKHINRYNHIRHCNSNYMSENFANTYFSEKDCMIIGCIREDIQQKYIQLMINKREYAILITSLLYAMDKIAMTCGHYDAYRKNVEFNNHIKLSIPDVPTNNNPNNQCFNENANDLVKHIKADMIYLDPPYNSRQYCDLYHLLENVAVWKKPTVYGVAKKMNRDNLKSSYCTTNAPVAFEDLIQNIDSKYILLSYNNMETKGDNRSNAKLSDHDILNILSKKGKVKVFEESHKAFSTGKSNIENNAERLFLCECYGKEDTN